MNYYYKEILRMDWGLGNPNKTAALIALLMIAVWAFSYFKKWGFWVSLTLFTGLGVCLIHTFSRGGILSLLVGVGILMWKTPRPWPKNRMIALIVSFGIMIGAAIWIQADERIAQGIAQEDRSITNRLLIWKYAPRMILDAPQGWGLGNSGKIFCDWYQPLDRQETYRTLVNSHLTWMAELGWIFSLCYVTIWISVLCFLFPRKGLESLKIPFALAVAFFISSTFNPVAENRWVSFIPMLGLLVGVFIRWRNHHWPHLREFRLVPLGLIVIASIIFILGKRINSIPFTLSPKKITVGSSSSSVWFIVKDLHSTHVPARQLRSAFASSSQVISFGVTTASEISQFKTPQTFIILQAPTQELEKFLESFPNSSQILWFSPNCDPDFALNHLKDLKKVHTFFWRIHSKPSLSVMENQNNFHFNSRLWRLFNTMASIFFIAEFHFSLR